MSNKQQLQTNNETYASLIETLRGKAAGGSGEDVTEETTAYTAKIATLETAITALETELEGKASGGGSGGGSIETCKVEISTSYGIITQITYTHVNNGMITSSYISTPGTSVTFEDVVCGSFLIFAFDSTLAPEQVIGAEKLGRGGVAWRITANAGETVVLKFWNPF